MTEPPISDASEALRQIAALREQLERLEQVVSNLSSRYR